MQRRNPRALVALMVVAAPLSHAQPDLKPGKIPVFIAPGEVTIDGEPRPDLGRSFSDTISGELLGTGQFTIIDPNIAPAPAPAADPFAEPAEKMVALAGPNAHYAFVPRLVVEDNYHRFTLKKVRVSDGEVVEIYDRSADSAERSAMFKLLDDTMRTVNGDLTRGKKPPKTRAERIGVIDLDPDPTTGAGSKPLVVPGASKVHYPPPPEEEGAAKPRVTEPGSPPGNRSDRPLMSAPKPPPKKKSSPAPPKRAATPAPAEEPREPGSQYAGRLRSVNPTWGFCIIESAKGVDLEKDDTLFVRSSTSLESLGTLRVSLVEGGQVVADSIDLALESLRSGLKVYR